MLTLKCFFSSGQIGENMKFMGCQIQHLHNEANNMRENVAITTHNIDRLNQNIQDF
jgi:hypothetical protein